MTSNTTVSRVLRASTAVAAMATILAAAPANAIVPNENTDSEAIVDTEGGVNGVGQFFRNDGFVCTGTLINPRTVLFAAHCVNDRPESDYDGGATVASAFSFEVDALPGFIDWIGNGFATNPELFVYNIAQIQYNAESLVNPAALGFIEADIALATLDTPAANIPTWALLFSALPDPGTIDPVVGTGYHVNITGYGGTGNAFDGAVDGVDFRRRAAENFLGALASLDDRNDVIFGPGAGTLPQNLYQFDFDAQDRDTDFRDINIHRDDALPNEGTTAGGDSGGPLILDAANNDITNEDLVIGTLSGGSAFFGPDSFSALGSTSFYQPLFLYWQYIAETNPYRYVGAAEGDGDWEDASHWTSLLDPNYRIIDDNGNIVNGLPSTPEEGRAGTGPDFGSVCVEFEAPADFCTDLATGETEDTSPPPAAPAAAPAGAEGIVSAIGTVNVADVLGTAAAANASAADGDVASTPASNIGILSADNIAISAPVGSDLVAGGDIAISGTVNDLVSVDTAPAEEVELASLSVDDLNPEERPFEDGMDMGPPALPPATIDNGLPGATDFVPDNIDVDVPGGVTGRFFDVTLSAAGTTTLSSQVEIDNLTVIGPAGLNVAAAGDLTSLLGVNQMGGSVNVDGLLTSGGDYTLFAGLLTGTGTIEAPFLTNIAGTISPGGPGTIGTLNVEGNLVLASGSTYELDLDSAGNSDLITVSSLLIPEVDADGMAVLNDDGTPSMVLDPNLGIASIGGVVDINPLTTFLFNDGDTYTILTADGAITGDFTTGFSGTSAVLDPTFNTVTNDDGTFSVQLVFNVNDYSDVVDQTSAVQTSYAALLDANRAQGLTSFGDIFGFTEFASAEELATTLEGLAPLTETTQLSISEMLLNSVVNFNRNRLSNAFGDERGGTIAVNTSPVQLASALNNGTATQSAFNAATAAQGATEGKKDSNLDSNFALYLSGGFLDGRGLGMPSTLSTESDRFDGYFFAGGLEYLPNDHTVVGISVSYSDVDGNVGAPTANQTVDGELLHGSIYGAIKTDGGLVFDGQIGIGTYDTSTSRAVTIGANAFTLNSNDESFVFTAEAGVSKQFKAGAVDLTPRVAFNYATISFDDVQESGGQPALQIQRDSFDTFQGRAGVTASFNRDLRIRPWVNADYVHDFADRDNSFGANFVGGTGGFAPFAIATDDSDWVEAAIGLNMDVGPVIVGLSAQTTIGRDDFQSQSYQGSIRFQF